MEVLMEQVVTHYGETIQQHSVEWYKKQLLKDFSVQFIKDSLLPQLFEWSNAYKAAVELTKQKSPRGAERNLYGENKILYSKVFKRTAKEKKKQ